MMFVGINIAFVKVIFLGESQLEMLVFFQTGLLVSFVLDNYYYYYYYYIHCI